MSKKKQIKKLQRKIESLNEQLRFHKNNELLITTLQWQLGALLRGMQRLPGIEDRLDDLHRKYIEPVDQLDKMFEKLDETPDPNSAHDGYCRTSELREVEDWPEHISIGASWFHPRAIQELNNDLLKASGRLYVWTEAQRRSFHR